MDTPAHIENRAATVASFDRNRDLQHRSAFDLSTTRQHSTDDASLQPDGIPDRNDRLTVDEFVGIPQWQGRKILGINAQDSQIK